MVFTEALREPGRLCCCVIPCPVGRCHRQTAPPGVGAAATKPVFFDDQFRAKPSSVDYQLSFMEILAEVRDEQRPSYLRRRLEYAVLPRKAVVLKGVRRSGKSTLLRQIEDDERAQGRKCLWVNFMDDRLAGLRAEHLRMMLDAFYLVYPDQRPGTGLTLLLDELQVVDGWETFVERQLRVRERRVFVTGPSAKLLSQEIASSMRGRSLAYEVFPFDFREYLALQDALPKDSVLGAEQKAHIKAQFQRYLFEGGFPETISVARRTQVQILQEYLDVLLLRDVIERHGASSPVMLRRLLLGLISRFASPFTINKLAEQLHAQGFSTTKSHVSEMFEWFADAYAVFAVKLLSESVHKQNTNPKKLYVIDNGFVNAVAVGRLENHGRLLENLVFLTLRRHYGELNYVRTARGHEVDFYNSELGLVQVAWSMSDAQTRVRELRALEEAMAELELREALIVTANDSDTVELASGTVHVRPAWEWLLDFGESD